MWMDLDSNVGNNYILMQSLETEAENDRAIAIAEELEHKSDRTNEESAILELLVALIEKFEDEHYPLPAGTPQQMLLHLMESNDVKHTTWKVRAIADRKYKSWSRLFK